MRLIAIPDCTVDAIRREARQGTLAGELVDVFLMLSTAQRLGLLVSVPPKASKDELDKRADTLDWLEAALRLQERKVSR